MVGGMADWDVTTIKGQGVGTANAAKSADLFNMRVSHMTFHKEVIDQKRHGSPGMSFHFGAGCAATAANGSVHMTALQPAVLHHTSAPTPLGSLDVAQRHAAAADVKVGDSRGGKTWTPLHTVRGWLVGASPMTNPCSPPGAPPPSPPHHTACSPHGPSGTS